MRESAESATGLLRRWWPLIAATLLGILAGLLYSLVKEPVYTSDAYVVVVSNDEGDTGQALNFAQAYARIVTQPAILATASGGGDLTLPVSTARLRRTVQASASPDAPLVGVNASAATPQLAAEQANAVAAALIAYGNSRSEDTNVRLASFASAFPPVSPSSPILPINVAVGAASGILVGGLACLILPVPSSGTLMRRLRTPRQAPGEASGRTPGERRTGSAQRGAARRRVRA
jgi:capsular polysaccharide biosynthesis protein